MDERGQWLRIGAEAFAIVAGILIAFAIDAWWQERQDDRWQREQLVALRDEFEANLSSLDWVVRMDEHIAGNIDVLLDEAGRRQIGDTFELPNSTLASLIHWRTSDISTGSLDALLASGRLGDIDDDAIRLKLAEWPSNVHDVQEDEALTRDFVGNVVVPGLLGQGILDTAYRWRPRPGFREQPADTQEMTTITVTPELLELATVRVSHARLAGYSVKRLQDDIRGLVGMIDAELGSQ